MGFLFLGRTVFRLTFLMKFNFSMFLTEKRLTGWMLGLDKMNEL